MILPKAFEKEVNDNLLLGLKGTLLYSTSAKVLAPKYIKSELSLQGLLEKNRIGAPENLKVDMLEIMEGFLVQKEYLLIDVSSEGQPPQSRSGQSEKEKKASGDGATQRYSWMISNPQIIAQLFGCS